MAVLQAAAGTFSSPSRRGGGVLDDPGPERLIPGQGARPAS
jgi:hypothetical protein